MEYKYQGSKDPGSGSGPLIREGGTVNIGDTVDLSDDQVKAYRAKGLKFTKTDGSDDDDNEKTPQAGATPAAPTQPTSTPSTSSGKK